MPIFNHTPPTSYAAGKKAGQETAQNAITDIDEQTNRLKARLNGDSTESQPMYDKVFNDGYTEGIEAGKNAEYDAFWDSINISSWVNLFSGIAWNNVTFKPTFDLIPVGNAGNMFYNCGFKGDMVELCERQGIIFDLSQTTNINFGYSMFTRLGVLDFRSITSQTLDLMFYNNDFLETIDKFIIKSDGSQNVGRILARTLKNITFEGVIGQNGCNISFSKVLSKESITSVVNALSSTTTNLTVTISLTAVNNAFATAEGLADGSTSQEWLDLAATKSNWTISLIDS